MALEATALLLFMYEFTTTSQTHEKCPIKEQHAAQKATLSRFLSCACRGGDFYGFFFSFLPEFFFSVSETIWCLRLKNTWVISGDRGGLCFAYVHVDTFSLDLFFDDDLTSQRVKLFGTHL